jgi:hypothetical protein
MNLRVFSLCLIVTLLFTQVPSANAASDKEKALALAASGCAMGWLDSPLLTNLSNFGTQVVMTATSSQWNDATNNEFVQIHHNQFLEGWSLAANLDAKWRKLSDTYSDAYEFIGQQASSGRLVGEIWNSAGRKYGGIFNANCKIAITSARSKAKMAKKSFPRWIFLTAGELLPTLDPRTKL